MAFINDSDEDEEEDEDMLLACILVGEYLEEKEERPKFYVRERIAWNNTLQKEMMHFSDCTGWTIVHS